MCAAHCRQSTNSWTAGAGSVNISGQRQNKSGSAQLPHPQYNANTIDYDYMILTIQGSWTFDDYVKPIKIVNASSSELPNNTPCQSSGYGYSQHIGNNPGVIASTLQWMDISCITIAECKKVWRLQTLTSRQQCASSDGVTSCMGDSGGPLTTSEDGEQKLLGNVSWGHSKCSVNGYPSAYSRNADPTANAWIKENAGLNY